jgi:plasmid maintenance system antidote protein VapI
MATTHNYHIYKMKEALSLKQRLNPHYSLRAFARDLEVHPATLSQVFKGNRPLPSKNAKRVVTSLNLSPKEKTLFLENLFGSKVALDQIKVDRSEERVM